MKDTKPKKVPLTAAQRQKKARERAKVKRMELAEKGCTEVSLVLTKSQLNKIQRYAKLTRILPEIPGDGLTSGQFLTRLTQPALVQFEKRFDELARQYGGLFEDMEQLRDLSTWMTDEQFKLDRNKERLWHLYVREPDADKAAKLLAQHNETMSQLSKSMGLEAILEGLK